MWADEGSAGCRSRTQVRGGLHADLMRWQAMSDAWRLGRHSLQQTGGDEQEASAGGHAGTPQPIMVSSKPQASSIQPPGQPRVHPAQSTPAWGRAASCSGPSARGRAPLPQEGPSQRQQRGHAEDALAKPPVGADSQCGARSMGCPGMRCSCALVHGAVQHQRAARPVCQAASCLRAQEVNMLIPCRTAAAP